MHSTLAELLENLKPGLLWVSGAGVVRYANGDAAARTGLAPGRKLYDPDLLRAVNATVSGRAPRAITVSGTPSQQGGPIPELKCRVIPGLSADDAFVLIGNDPDTGGAAAFDNLMQVIRSDISDPLDQADAALHVARQGGAELHSLEALGDAVGEVLKTLHKLVDLAGLWGSSSLLSNDRIELWPLLQQVWRDVEPLALERSVKVRFRAQGATEQLATLYGSEPWLKRIFMECLEAAVRASRPGATLDIEHRQLGPRALIVFRDCGVFAPANQDAVELRSDTKAPAGARLHARDLIGLKLCQHIVSLHGGQLREEDEDGLRNFLIDLPTGAPHRNDESQLDIAQAQQYAQDLAVLMTRARKARASDPPAGVA
jgi:hypothetical protein